MNESVPSSNGEKPVGGASVCAGERMYMNMYFKKYYWKRWQDDIFAGTTDCSFYRRRQFQN